jgi:hypothetical protein
MIGMFLVPPVMETAEECGWYGQIDYEAQRIILIPTIGSALRLLVVGKISIAVGHDSPESMNWQ